LKQNQVISFVASFIKLSAAARAFQIFQTVFFSCSLFSQTHLNGKRSALLILFSLDLLVPSFHISVFLPLRPHFSPQITEIN